MINNVGGTLEGYDSKTTVSNVSGQDVLFDEALPERRLGSHLYYITIKTSESMVISRCLIPVCRDFIDVI